MSVAFRRDSDEEHLEPKFELPVPPGPNMVTERGHALIKGKVEALETAVAEAGDEQRAELQRDLRYWRSRLATAQILPAPSGDAVVFGTLVEIEQGGAVRRLAIVGHDEADPASGRIGFASPIARALMGAEPGDEVDLPGSNGETVRVISISGDQTLV